MWSLAKKEEDAEIVQMSLALYREDPAQKPVYEKQIFETLNELRTSPVRGRVAVYREADCILGYAILISFWSNELGGEICTVDELYVKPEGRGKGWGSALVQSLQHDRTIWSHPPVAIELEVTPQNERARALYARLGFLPKKNAVMRLRFN